MPDRSALPSAPFAELADRARALGFALESDPETLAQRVAVDDAVLDGLRDRAAVEAALARLDDEAGADGADRARRLRPRGRRPVPPPSAVPPSGTDSTWLHLFEDAGEPPAVAPAASGPLAGFEVGVKDLLAVRGHRMTAGTRAFRAEPAAADSAAVAALRRAGATIRGTTNLHPLAYGITGGSSDWGVPVNPVAPGRLPGGSSSGSASAVAAGTADIGLSTDTGGSIRLPAALCGVVGVKPTQGLVDVAGAHPLAQRLDCIGPIVASVAHAAAAMAALAGWSEAELPAGFDGELRIGVLGGWFAEGVAADVAAGFAAALERFAAIAGARLERVEAPLAPLVPAAQLAILGAQALENNLPTLRDPAAPLVEDVRLRLETGLARTPEQFGAAMLLRAAWIEVLESLLRRVDVLVGPTAMITAPPIGAPEIELGGGERLTTQYALSRFTMPFNVSGHPAVSLPFRDAAGTLIGVQAVGRRHGDRELLAIAGVLEEALR